MSLGWHSASNFAFLKCPFLLRLWAPLCLCSPRDFKVHWFCCCKLLLLDAEDEWGVAAEARGRRTSADLVIVKARVLRWPCPKAVPGRISFPCVASLGNWLLGRPGGAGTHSSEDLNPLPLAELSDQRTKMWRATTVPPSHSQKGSRLHISPSSGTDGPAVAPECHPPGKDAAWNQS